MRIRQNHQKIESKAKNLAKFVDYSGCSGQEDLSIVTSGGLRLRPDEESKHEDDLQNGTKLTDAASQI